MASPKPTIPTQEGTKITMATKNETVARTQAQLTKDALAQLAIIGGRMTSETDITFEGRKFVFPEQFKGDLNGLQRYVERYVESQEEVINVNRTFKFRPNDGANAVYHCLKDFFGYAQSMPIQSFFGTEPPQEITISVGYVAGVEQHVTVPWGKLMLPGLKNGYLYTGAERTKEDGICFQMTAQCRRADKEVVEGFFHVVGKFLDENSIYRGHAITGGMGFLDTDLIHPEDFIYTEDVWRDVTTNILSPMKDTKALEAHGLSAKRVVLLEGPYGTGKSGLGRTAAKVAEANGWTAIIARPGADDPFEVLRTARLYQPSMVFIEDVDTFADSTDPNYVTKLLDQFDGFGTKDLRMLLVLTTNHADRIHKGMLRPGRLDSVIHIGNMDRPGVERLTRLVVRDALAEDVDFDAIFEATADFTPAYVREGLERAVRYTIARTGQVGGINTVDIVAAMNSLRAQLGLQVNAKDRAVEVPSIDQAIREAVNTAVDGVVGETIDSKLGGAGIWREGKHIGTLALND